MCSWELHKLFITIKLYLLFRGYFKGRVTLDSICRRKGNVSIEAFEYFPTKAAKWERFSTRSPLFASVRFGVSERYTCRRLRNTWFGAPNEARSPRPEPKSEHVFVTDFEVCFFSLYFLPFLFCILCVLYFLSVSFLWLLESVTVWVENQLPLMLAHICM